MTPRSPEGAAGRSISRYRWADRTCPGVVDTARGTPITESTDFRVGSVSKKFTAIEIMHLRDRGLLELDDPVSRFGPDPRASRQYVNGCPAN
jgi:hypothetical protein